MFEITPEQIAKLTDTDARTLVGLLAEREAIRHAADSSAVTFGGDQRAADGGIDVRASLPASTKPQGYLPRLETGFQVKAENFSPSKITTEMRPGNTLRETISDLGRSDGAYIIVSTHDSLSDAMLSRRKNAMAAAISDEPDAAGLHLDFYDRVRIARWVNQHPGLIPWVRLKVGDPLSGWRPFGDWSSSPEELSSEYLLDDQVRLVGVQLKDSDGLDIEAGINKIRQILRQPGGIVRLVGLSGVGKTRLVQALFDHRIGDSPLDEAAAVYTDISDAPDPVPLELLGRLVALDHACVLVVDNCGVELHRKLAARLKQSANSSQIRFITVEYDISDDEPEGTDVFKLEPSSPEVLERIIERRYPALTNPEIRTVARFSEGNARVAIALAEASKGETSLANMSDSELFKRLFFQNKKENPSLTLAAKAMALVYSFDGETSDGEDAELPLLAKLAGQSFDEFYGHVAELRRRKLVQARGKWRALLPHALAHKLAKEFLQDRPAQRIADAFVSDGSQRLVKSFSRRLGFLHDSDEAQRIVEQWLGADGWLSQVECLNDFGLTLLDNIAPVAPERVLQAIAESTQRVDSIEELNDGSKRVITRLLRALAYEPDLFDQSAGLIAQLASAEKSNNVNDPHNEFLSLFYLYLSGTHAPAKQRADLLRSLAKTGSEKDKILVLGGLDSMLKTGHFTSFGSFDFGTRRRDYGFHPRTREDVSNWYKQGLMLLRDLIDDALTPRDRLKQIFASHFEDLARSTGLSDEIIELAEHIHANFGWPEGWGSARATARRAEEDGQAVIAARYCDLAEKLEPKDLGHLIEAYVLPDGWSTIDLVDLDLTDTNKYEEANKKIEAVCANIGSQLAENTDALRQNLARLITSKSTRLENVGFGLGQSSRNPTEVWTLVSTALIQAGRQDGTGIGLAMGFLRGLHTINPEAVESFLDIALDDEGLRPFFINLQCSVDVSDRGWERILASANHATVPTWSYRNLAYRPAEDAIDDDRLSEIISLIRTREDGFETALFVLHIRLFRASSNEKPPSEREQQIARELLSSIDFAAISRHGSYELKSLAEIALRPEKDHAVAVAICEHLLDALSNTNVYGWNYTELVSYLAVNFPLAVLDILVEKASSAGKPYRLQSIFDDIRDTSHCPIGLIDTATLVSWAQDKQETRFLLLAEVLRPWKQQGEGAVAPEWSPAVLALLSVTPNPEAFLQVILERLTPMSWSGSRAEIMERRLPLFETLKGWPNAGIAEAAAKAESEFSIAIQSQREWEARDRREQDERFEW